MSTSMEGNYYVPHPLKRKADFFPIEDLSDFMWIAFVLTSVSIIANQVVDEFRSIVYLIGAVFLILTLYPVFEKKHERLYYLFVVAPILELYYILRRGKIYRDGDKEKWPYEVRAFGDIGLIYHLDKGTYSMVFKTSGSTMSTMNLTAQMGQNSMLAKIIRRASAATKLRGMKISFGYDIRPENPFAVSYMLAKTGAPNVLLPEAVMSGKPLESYTRQDRRETYLRQIANEMEEMAFYATRPDNMVFVVTIKDNRVFRKILRRGEGWTGEVRNQTIFLIRETLTLLLKKVAQDVRLITGPEAEEYLQVARSITDAYQMYTEQHLHNAALHEQQEEDAVPDALIELESGETEKPSEEYRFAPAPQREITAYSDALSMDGTYGTVIELTEFPLDQPPVDYLRDYSPVFNLPADFFTLNVMGQTKKGSLQSFTHDLGNLMSDSTRSLLGREKQGLKAELLQEKRDEEAHRLNTTYTINFTAEVAILATDREKLEDQALRSINLLGEETMGPARVTGRFRQFKALRAAITHIPE